MKHKDTRTKRKDSLSRYLAERGLAHAMLGRLDAAVKDLTRALELDPTNARTLLRTRARCYEMHGQRALAEKDLAAANK